ncbi:Ionotropic receptor 93a [Carabus blaptoides fortunei]
MNYWLVLFIVGYSTISTAADNFPSLLSSNATIGIVIDKEYMAKQYSNIKETIEMFFIYAKREILKHGGINVQYYSWTSINVKRDFTGILSVASCKDTWKLYNTIVSENILFMAISEPDCPRLPSDLAITVPLLKNGEELPQLLLDLRSRNAYDWNSAIILHDETLERDMVTRVVTSLTGHNSGVTSTGMSLTVLKLENQTTEFQQRQIVTDVLAKLPLKQLGKNFLVIVSFPYVNSIMEVAKNLGLVTPYSQWLYVISDTNENRMDISTLRNLIGEGDNVAFVYNVTTNSASCTKGIHCHCEELLEAFMKSLESAIQDEISISSQVSDEEWEAIRPTKPERRDSLLQGVKTHLSTVGACSNCTKWQLKAGDTWGRTYMQNHNDELLQVGFWRPSDGVSFTDEMFPHIKHKFRGRVLPLVTYHNPPWQILTINESGSVSDYRGLTFDIIRELSRRLNFTYILGLSKTDTNLTTRQMDLIELTNMIPDDIANLVMNNKVFMAACAFTINNRGKKIINFTIPISIQSHTLLVARPRQLSRALLFISPFTYDTWLCLALAIIIMGPILYFINKYSPVYGYRGKAVKGLENIQNCMWYIYGALLQQGGMYLPEADSARLVIGTWWLVVLVVVTTYCGNLVAFLTFPKIDIPIRTIDDLFSHRDSVTWGITNGTFLDEYLKETDIQRYQELNNGIVIHDQLTPQIVSEVRDRTHVFIGWKMKIAYIMKKNFIESGACDFAFGIDDFLDEQIAMIVSQDNPYLDMINDEINRLHQVGLIEKWLKDYMPKKDRCWKVGHVTEVNNHTVNIDDMQGCFFVLFLGFALAALLMIFEKCYHQRKLKKVKSVLKPFVS